MGAGKKEVVAVAMGTGFFNKYSKLNENTVNDIISLSVYK